MGTRLNKLYAKICAWVFSMEVHVHPGNERSAIAPKIRNESGEQRGVSPPVLVFVVHRQIVCASSLGIRFCCLLVFVARPVIHREAV